MRFFGPEIIEPEFDDYDHAFWGWLPEGSVIKNHPDFLEVLEWLETQTFKGKWYWGEGQIRETRDKGWIVQVDVTFNNANDALMFKMRWVGSQVPTSL